MFTLLRPATTFGSDCAVVTGTIFTIIPTVPSCNGTAVRGENRSGHEWSSKLAAMQRYLRVVYSEGWYYWTGLYYYLDCDLGGIAEPPKQTTWPRIELWYGAKLGDPATVHHNDPITRGNDGIQPMSYREDRSVPHHLAQHCLKLRIGPAVYGRRGLVQDDNSRSPHKRAGDGDQRPLAVGDVGSILFDFRVQV